MAPKDARSGDSLAPGHTRMTSDIIFRRGRERSTYRRSVHHLVRLDFRSSRALWVIEDSCVSRVKRKGQALFELQLKIVALASVGGWQRVRCVGVEAEGSLAGDYGRTDARHARRLLGCRRYVSHAD